MSDLSPQSDPKRMLLYDRRDPYEPQNAMSHAPLWLMIPKIMSHRVTAGPSLFCVYS
jgi:hypothetical protein